VNKVKFTIEMPADKYCGDCPCLGLNGKEEEHCGYFNKPLNSKGQHVIKCGECKVMTKMLIAESEVKHDGGNLPARYNKEEGRGKSYGGDTQLRRGYQN
jgi:hypothetical protein